MAKPVADTFDTEINYPNLLSRIDGKPVMITPAKAEIIIGALVGRLWTKGELTRPEGETVSLTDLSKKSASLTGGSRPKEKVYRVVEGIAIIPATGTLVNKNGLHPFSGMTGYDGIGYKLREALNDPDVIGIMLDIESPGGEVDGCFDLADEIREANAIKPVWASLSDYAYSAAYALASQCSRIFVPRTGGVGSVGVVMTHVDHSRALEGKGLNITMIHAGAHKVDGNPYEPLPENVRASLQSGVDKVYGMFTDLVSKGRNISSEAVRGTEAQLYMGRDGIDVGFADEIGSPRQAFLKFKEHLSARNSGRSFGANAQMKTSRKENSMDNDETTQDAENTSVDLEAQVSEARKEGAQQERNRIAGILTCEEADGRQKLANYLAFETDDTVEKATGALAASPKEVVETKTAQMDPLSQAMETEENPQVTANGGDDSGGDDGETKSRNLASAYKKAVGQ